MRVIIGNRALPWPIPSIVVDMVAMIAMTTDSMTLDITRKGLWPFRVVGQVLTTESLRDVAFPS